MYNIAEVKRRAIKILSVVCEIGEGMSKEDACKKYRLDINELNEFLKIGVVQNTNEMSIKELGLKKHTLTHLEYTGIDTVSDLLEFIERYDLHTISGIGNGSIADIIKCVKEKCNLDISFASMNTDVKCTSDNYDGRLLSLPLSLCGFSDNAFNSLVRLGYRTIEDLVKAIHNDELEFALDFSDLDCSLENLGFEFIDIKDYCVRCRAWIEDECAK